MDNPKLIDAHLPMPLALTVPHQEIAPRLRGCPGPVLHSRPSLLQRYLSALLLLVASGVSLAQAPAPVTTAIAERQPLYRIIPMTGTVTSPRSARLSAAISGQVQAIDVDAGTRVAADDLLLVLDPELAEHALASAQAEQKQAEVALADAQRRLREARELIPQASIAESTVRDLEAEVTTDKAALEQMAADVALRRAQLARHQLRAPFSGVVSRKLTELGEWVTPGTPVLELVATEGIRLDFSVAEDFLGIVHTDARVNYATGAAGDRKYHGIIDAIVPVTDPKARTFLIRVLPDGERPALRPGMSVTASLAVSTGREGLVVPRDALQRYSDGRMVLWILSEDDPVSTVREQRVQTGLQFDGLVEILAGVHAGDRVVVEGNETLRDGQRVQPRARTTPDV